MQCDFCKNTFSSKVNLNSHQKNAKYCLNLRGESSDSNYKCDGCGKTFTKNSHLSRHEKICRSNEKLYELENQLLQLEKERDMYKLKLEERDYQIEKQQERYDQIINQLQKQMQEVAIKAVSRPTTSNKTQINNYIQNMQPVTDECLIDNVQHLTIEHIKKGPEGYAEFALEYPLKDRMLCSDYSRRKVKFKDKDGNLITDPEMTTLAKKFFSSIKDKNKELICRCANELKEKLGDDNVMDTVVKLFDYKAAIEQGSDGEKTEFHHDFVRQMCSHTLKE